MTGTRWSIGIDISTQTISAMLIGVMESGVAPAELLVTGAWMSSRPCGGDAERRTPATWVRLVRECLDDLRKTARETEMARAIGVSTTFPGVFLILRGGIVDPGLVSLYDNTDDAGLSGAAFEEAFALAETETVNRMWPGNMAIGLAHLIKSHGLRLEDVDAVVPPNTAFAHALLTAAGHQVSPRTLPSDLTQTTISGLYDSRTAEPLPPAVAKLMDVAAQDGGAEALRGLLSRAEPSWRNVVPAGALSAVRKLLGLPRLEAVSIGAGDSPLGSLALLAGEDTVINVRGSSDSPMLVVPSLKERCGARESVLHYPLPTARTAADSPWCVVAPMLRSGRVWDWVRGLRYPRGDGSADRELEALALEALKRRLRSPKGSLERRPLLFDPALGGERAPGWDPRATGSIVGLIETHTLGDIALAALEGVSAALARCISLMEDRYSVHPDKLLLAGGPARNALWNWVTQVFTGKKTFATTFSDASLLGAAMMGYAASFDGHEDDDAIAERLFSLSRLASGHPLIDPVPVSPPDEECARLEQDYADQRQLI